MEEHVHGFSSLLFAHYTLFLVHEMERVLGECAHGGVRLTALLLTS